MFVSNKVLCSVDNVDITQWTSDTPEEKRTIYCKVAYHYGLEGLRDWNLAKVVYPGIDKDNNIVPGYNQDLDYKSWQCIDMF